MNYGIILNKIRNYFFDSRNNFLMCYMIGFNNECTNKKMPLKMVD